MSEFLYRKKERINTDKKQNSHKKQMQSQEIDITTRKKYIRNGILGYLEACTLKHFIWTQSLCLLNVQEYMKNNLDCTTQIQHFQFCVPVNKQVSSIASFCIMFFYGTDDK